MNLDDICNTRPINREVYGYDPLDKPNNHCYWDDYFLPIEENDEHFRERIKILIKENIVD